MATLVVAGALAPGSASAESEALIGGWAFHDRDRDGVRDAGELGLTPTTICLVGADWCDRTEWGEFMFDLLPAGTYRVKLTELPDGFRPTTPRTVRIVLGDGEIRQEVNFGLIPTR